MDYSKGYGEKIRGIYVQDTLRITDDGFEKNSSAKSLKPIL
jgi:hypothetical protein